MGSIYDNLYIICAAAGLVSAAVLLAYVTYRRSLDRVPVFLCYLGAVIGAFIGAHLMFFIVGLPGFREKYSNTIHDVASFLDAFLNASSGMVFYGGLFGAILAVIIICRSGHLDTRTFLNAAACAFPMIHAFGRIGCTLDGCCYGIEYHGIFAIQYSQAQINPGISDALADFPRFPVQPLEALLEFALCFLIVRLFIKTGARYPLLSLYLFLYGIVRFSDEFLRGDEIRGLWGPFSTSQWIALACIVGVLIYYVLGRNRIVREETA